MVRRRQKQKHLADTILHVNHALPLLTITNGTGGAGKTSGTRHRAKKEGGETAHRGEEGTDTPEHPLPGGTRSAGEVGGQEKGGEGSLPSLTRRHHGASTSQGFALHPPAHKAQKGPHTATTVQRQVTAHGNALPDIAAPRISGRLDRMQLLHMESGADGLTRMMHTFHQASSLEGGGNGPGKERGGVGGGKTTEDERYRMLEKLLVRIEPPNEGYLELSPSFHSPRQAMTFTRPSSLHASLYRSSSSISPGPFIISSLWSSTL